MVQSPSNKTDGFLHRFRRSLMPTFSIPRTQIERKRYIVQHLLLHVRPATVPESTLRLSHSLGLGGMATSLVMVQIVSGILLKFVYVPTPLSAYASVQYLISDVPFGRLVRNLHHWSAHLLVLIAFFHMLRVLFTGAFHPPRQFNWIIGLTMFGTLLFANFTGYLLPWDQLAYWAVTISTGMLEYVPLIGTPIKEMIHGGSDIGPTTLGVFFTIHTAVIPFLVLILMSFHFWRIRKAGGLILPRRLGEPPVEHILRVPSLPNLLLRELALALLLFAMLLMFSIFWDAPFAEPANPGLSPNPIKAPWYFAGLQELLLHLHPVFAVSVVPLMVTIALIAVPYIQSNNEGSGIWWISLKGRRMGIIAAVVALIGTPTLLLVDEWLVKPNQESGVIPSIIRTGLIPVSLLLVVAVLTYWIPKRYFAAKIEESVQTLFILVSVAFGVLTTIGVFFRGPGMALVLPW